MAYLGPNPDGSAILPGSAFSSELSLGWYRSAASTVALSYGTLALPTAVVVNTVMALNGTALARVDTNAGTIQVAGGTPGASGNIILFGGTATPAQEIRFRQGTTIQWRIGVLGSLTGLDGTALAPALGFSSESSLGLYRSGVSSLGLSYGALMHPDGSNTTPSIGYSSNTSLGFYSSGVQTIAQSYGTLNLATNSVRLSMRTLAGSAVTASAAKTNVAVNEVVFTVTLGSGASLLVYSGGTVWGFNSTFSVPAA